MRSEVYCLLGRVSLSWNFICLLSHYISYGLFFLFSEAQTQKKRIPRFSHFVFIKVRKTEKNNITDVAWEWILRCG